jgi:hypothetical protein
MSFLKSIVRTAGRGVKKVGKAAGKGVKTVGKTAGKGVKAVGRTAKRGVNLTGKVVTLDVKGVVKDTRGLAKDAVRTAATASRGVKNTIGKVPIVGKPLSSVYRLTIGMPYEVANSVVSGERLDKVAIGTLKKSLQDVKDVAPYAQTVIAIVPGIGPGISAGIGAGLALASGQPITEALKAGVMAAVPGGALGKSVANISYAVIQKKPLDAALLSGIPLPAGQKHALSVVLSSAKALADGKRIDKVALEAAQKQLPPDVMKAAKIGVAISQGKNLQAVAKANVKPAILTGLQKKGRQIVSVNPVVRAGFSALKDPHQQAGFSVGAAISRFQVSPNDVVAVRAKLTPQQKKGFDMALAAHVGAVTTTAEGVKTAAEQFAFNATVGASELAKGNQKALVSVLASDTATRAGMNLAVNAHLATPNVEFTLTTAKKTFWRRVAEWLGIAK